MSLFNDIVIVMESTDALANAKHFADQFLSRHHELQGSVRTEGPSFMLDQGRVILPADVMSGSTKIGELQFDISYRDDGLVGIMQHFYKDDKVTVGKGQMSAILDDWLDGLKKLGVKRIVVVGGTKFWNHPAKKHPWFDWSGFSKV